MYSLCVSAPISHPTTDRNSRRLCKISEHDDSANKRECAGPNCVEKKLC